MGNLRRYEFVIVGSGAGGATLAMELAKRGKDVLVVEKGKYEHKFGRLRDLAGFYGVGKGSRTRRRSQEGVIIYRTIMAGGTTVISCGNGMPSLEKEFHELGISLEKEFAEAAREMNLAPIPERLLSEGSHRLKSAAESLGYSMRLMPKFMADVTKCRRCGRCLAGCSDRAKWSAIDYLDEAIQYGADVVYETTATRVLTKHGRARGIVAFGLQGETIISADTVVISAGALETPLILNLSGIEKAGRSLFLDLFVNTLGEAKGANQIREPMMALINDEFHATRGFILAPFINRWKLGRYSELGRSTTRFREENLIGLMTKIADESVGRIFPDGSVSKSVTEKDRERLRAGSSLAREILIKAGAAEDSIFDSMVQGAHPGSTAAIGKVVDNDLQTKVDNLFVCDASVLPLASGLPPILTIVALAKRLAKTLL